MAGFTRLTEKQSICPECGESFASLSRHWGHAPSHRPPMDVLQRAVCAGLVLGGCKIDTQNQTPALDVRTRRLGFAVWLHEHLGWLANTIQYNPPGDHQATPTFIVRTVAHPELDTFRRWRAGEDRPTAAATVVTMLTVRTWVAKTAGVGWSGESKSRTTRFHAEDETTRDWYRRVLDHLGYDPYDSGRRLELHQSDSADLFKSIGPPVPGVEHKWAFDKEDYEERRREQWIEQQEVADAVFREGALGANPAAWGRKYSEREALQSLLSASDGERLSHDEYDRWRSGRPNDKPSMHWYKDNGTWRVWLSLAGLRRQRGAHPPPKYTLDDMVQAAIRVRETTGEWPIVQEYKTHRREEDPHKNWIYENEPDGIDSWPDLIDRAEAQYDGDA